MTFVLILFVVSIALAAAAASTFLWSRFANTPPGRWEAWASTSVLTFVIAIAVTWLLSWFDRIDRPALVFASLALAAMGVFILHRHGSFRWSRAPLRFPQLAVFSLAPLLLWIAFVLWRGALVPVLSHDALAYHMPKAVMIARAHHNAFFAAPDPRIGTSPANYELLLADVLLLTGSDALTEWIGTAAYLALLLMAAALAERWWGKGPHIVVTVLLTAAVPVILLHAGAHKNDLLANLFYTAALFWGGRWLASRETAPLLLALLSLAAAGGTKLQGAFPAAALVVVAVGLLVRRRLTVSKRQMLILAASVPVALLLLGGWVYVDNIVHTGQAALPASSSSDAGYGDWTNLVEVPLLILMRPFNASVRDVFVPWRNQHWYWPRFELYFSDFGGLVTLLLLVLPLAAIRYGRRGPERIRRERAVTSVAAVIAFLLMLPIRIRPLGFFAGFPRYFVFIAIFVIAWTATPMLRELWLRRKTFVVSAITAACAGMLVVVAITYTIKDAFQPLAYVAYVARHPEVRQPFFAAYRAATIVDQLAAPTDTIAIHAGFDSWIYPLYGRSLRRKVIFVEPGQPIPAEARFVLVDRTWNIIWGDPRFRNMGQYLQYLAAGAPTDEDVAVLKVLAADRRTYRPVYYLPQRNQAVFMRRDSGPLPRPVAVPEGGSSH